MNDAKGINGLPPNCIAKINGNLVCENDAGRFDIFAVGIGWWGFSCQRDDALRAAETVAVPGQPVSKNFREDQPEAV